MARRTPWFSGVQRRPHHTDFSYKVHRRVKCGPCLYRYYQMYSASTTMGMISNAWLSKGYWRQMLHLFRFSSRNHKKNGNESEGRGNLPHVGAYTISLALCLECSTIELTWRLSSHKLSWLYARVYKISPVPLTTVATDVGHLFNHKHHSRHELSAQLA